MGSIGQLPLTAWLGDRQNKCWVKNNWTWVNIGQNTCWVILSQQLGQFTIHCQSQVGLLMIGYSSMTRGWKYFCYMDLKYIFELLLSILYVVLHWAEKQSSVFWNKILLKAVMCIFKIKNAFLYYFFIVVHNCVPPFHSILVSKC